MASEWKNVTIGDIGTLQRGFDISKKEQRPGTIPVVSSGGIGSYHDEAKQDGPGVMLGRKGTLGSVYWIDQPYWPHSTSLWVKDFHGNDPKFVYYFFKAMGPDLLRMDVGAANPTLNRNHVHPLPALRPPLPIQKRIAHILGTLDDKIELNRRMNATLEAMARALFRSWFVDFDPVRAKADGRKPSGLDAATAALFPDAFQDSEPGPIPKGWEIGPILERAELLSGGTPKTSNASYWDGDISWASAKDVSQCGQAFVISTERRITSEGLIKSSTKIIPKFATVIVSRGATTGRLAMFGDEIAMNQTCYALKAKDNSDFALYCHVRHFIERLVSSAHGSVFDTITTSTFKSTDVILADRRILSIFNEAVSPLFQEILANLHQSRTLAAIRDSLLPKLLSGELSVAKGEQQTERAV